MRRVFRNFLIFVLLAKSLYAKELLFSTLYDLAIANSNEVKAANYRYLSEKEAIKQTKAGLYPQLDLNGFYKKAHYTTNPNERVIKQGLYSASVSLKQSLYNAAIYSKIDIQKIQTKHALIQTKLQKQQLSKDIFKTYLDIIKTKSKIDSLKSSMVYEKSKLQALQKQYAMHLSNKTDVLKVQVDYDSSKIALSKEKRLLRLYKLQLEHYIGKHNYEAANIEIDDEILPVLYKMRNAIAKKANSLEVEKALIETEYAKKEIDDAFSGHLPTLSLQASYGYYKTDTPEVQAPYKYTKTAMITLDIPLYKGGYTSSQVESAKLRYKAAAENLEATRKKVDIAYSEDMTEFNSALDAVTIHKEAYDSALLYLEAMEASFQKGLKSVIELNNAKAKLDEMRYKYIENLATLIEAYVGLLIDTNKIEDIKLLDKLIKK